MIDLSKDPNQVHDVKPGDTVIIDDLEYVVETFDDDNSWIHFTAPSSPALRPSARGGEYEDRWWHIRFKDGVERGTFSGSAVATRAEWAVALATKNYTHNSRYKK